LPVSAPTRHYTPVTFGQMHYREAGAGFPLLLLHKTPSSSVMYERSLPIFAEHFRTIALDTPGFGMSDPMLEQPSMEDYGASIASFMDSVGLERAHVIGHHTGASIALEFAAKFPDRVDRLGFCGILALETEQDKEPWRDYIIRYELDSHGDFLPTYPLHFLHEWLTKDDPEQFLEELVAYLQPGPTYTHAYDAVVGHEPFTLLPELPHQTLFLNPEGNRCYEQTVRAAQVTPTAVYREIPGGSEVAMDAPATFASPIIDFLSAP